MRGDHWHDDESKILRMKVLTVFRPAITSRRHFVPMMLKQVSFSAGVCGVMKIKSNTYTLRNEHTRFLLISNESID